MLLVLDMGNSHITVGAFSGKELLFEARIATDRRKTGDQYGIDLLNILRLFKADAPFHGAIISSVVPSLDHALADAVTKVTGCRPVFVGPGLKTGMNILIDNPSQLGADLLVGAVAAVEEYGAPCVVWDLGTATTVSAIDQDGAFRGGAIMPGISTAFQSLVAQTSLLPSIRLEAPKKAIGTNTTACMQSGAVYGNVAMIDGMTQRFFQELQVKSSRVIITGGLGQELAAYCGHHPIYDPHLLLKGLRILYEKQRR